MPFSVVMPALEMAQETGKLLAWRKKEGDRVSKGEPLLEIETDKAVVEVEAPAEGVLAGIRASEGMEIPVGQTIAWIVAPGEQPPIDDASLAAPSARAGAHTSGEESRPLAAPAIKMKPAAIKISPKARRMARELSVDIEALCGSGPDGEILASDVRAAAGVPTSGEDSSSPRPGGAQTADVDAVADPTPDGRIEIPTTIGRIMAERTAQSWSTVPHFFVSRDLDAAMLNEYRSRINAEFDRSNGVLVTHTDLLTALVSRVLMMHPRLNASWTPAGIRLHDHVHMGVAVAVGDGVVAAVIRNAHTAGLVEISQRRRDLSERARTGKLRPADIADATFTISNLGMYKVDHFSAIIIPPQAAILAVGAINNRVVAEDGKPKVRPMMTLTLSCDHRVVDGACAAMFLADVAAAVSVPSELLSR